MSDENTTVDENTATILELPKLPTTVQGDGRYVMSLLRQYLEEATLQINLANGFTAEEIDESSEGAVQTPKNFRLTFDSSGGHFAWDHITNYKNLAYYELRTDTLVGTSSGLLDRTIDNSSTKMSTDYVDHIYLYAFDNEGQISNPAELYYNKPRPDAPTDIATSKSDEGVLITFSNIPSDCMGANIYIEGSKYVSTSNAYLLTQDISSIEKVEVAFFDPFGEGEIGILYFVLPDVTGFLVERNGAELDFYWDAVNVYNVKYLVKVSERPDWSMGIELFKTTTNDKNRLLYPNTGDYYLLVKAYDDYGNFSKNAAYQLMTTDVDISRNVILDYPQADTLYSATKINLFYNPLIEGLTLDRLATRGEYIFDVQLPQEYKARNWLELTAFSWSGENRIMWQDAHFMWKNARRQWATISGNLDSSSVKQEIAMRRSLSDENIFNAPLNGNLTEVQHTEEPFESQNADDFQNGRWALGLVISSTTRLAYNIHNLPLKFTATFCMITEDPLVDTIIMTFTNAQIDYLCLSFNSRESAFVLTGSDGTEVKVPIEQSNNKEYYTFGISQDSTSRTLYVNQYSINKTFYSTIEVKPINNFTILYCYSRIFYFITWDDISPDLTWDECYDTWESIIKGA